MNYSTIMLVSLLYVNCHIGIVTKNVLLDGVTAYLLVFILAMVLAREGFCHLICFQGISEILLGCE